MNDKKAFKVLGKESNIKKGDTVKVLRTAKNYEMGWNDSWRWEMNEYVNKEFKVAEILKGSVRLNDFWFPFFVLEIIGENIDGQCKIPDFGCQTDNVRKLITEVLDKRYVIKNG